MSHWCGHGSVCHSVSWLLTIKVERSNVNKLRTSIIVSCCLKYHLLAHWDHSKIDMMGWNNVAAVRVVSWRKWGMHPQVLHYWWLYVSFLCMSTSIKFLSDCLLQMFPHFSCIFLDVGSHCTWKLQTNVSTCKIYLLQHSKFVEHSEN